ncbi:MAG: hypothetical protein IJV11_05845 [Muribaculaceae bacterium]|nr:hypothetical protein [Muribaculaceae bacterium]
MKHLVLIILALAIVSCTGRWQPGDAINNGHDYLCNAGICDDSLMLTADEFRYDNDGEALPHRILDLATCQAIGLDKVMHVDTNTTIVRVWNVRDYKDKGITLLMGQTSYSDTRTCWLATYGKDGMIDFMRLGECGGMNLSYWDDVDEHTRNVGIDSMRMVMPKGLDKPINVSRWVSYNVQRDGVDTDSTLWFIDNELPVTIGGDGRFAIGKIGTVYSTDTTLLTPYWRYKRQLEVMAWTPLSDTTFCDKVEALLDEAEGHITEPAQLLGDFHTLVMGRLYCDTQGVMQWCLDHPDAQLTRGLVKIIKEVSPEWTLNEFKKIKDPQILARSKQLVGLK